MRRAMVLMSIVLLLVLCRVAFAQGEAPVIPGQIGSVVFLEGVGDIARNGQTPEFTKEKEPVYLHDTIRTKSYSKMEITFLDKSVLKVAPDSCVSIEEYTFSDKNKREHSRIKLTRGKVEAVVSKTGMPDTFLIDTPNAQGAVKGSDIFVSYLGGKTGVFVLDGAISVVNPALPGTKIHVTKENCVVVPFNEAPGEIRAVRDAEIDYLKSSVKPSFIKKWIPSKDSTQMNGVIVAVTGTVRLYKKGAENWKEPKVNDIVSEGDKLQTEENSTIEIRMVNGNTMVLQPYTELGFTTLRQDPASGNYKNTLEIKTGRLSAIVTRTKDQMAFQVQTPTAICGVRGTFMEVAVIPPAGGAPGTPGSGPTQPVTQVFFEGGNGYITSNLSGQTQDIGSGQNAVVDALGKISAPLNTAPEQRSNMFQTWTSSQTMNNYSNAGGATGVGSNAQQQQPLPQGALQGVEALPQVKEEVQNFIDQTSSLQLNDLNNPATEPIIQPEVYNNTLPLNVVEGEGLFLTSGSMTVHADSSTWNMTTSGTWIETMGNTVGTFQSGNDVVVVATDPINEDGKWSGNVAGEIMSVNPHLLLTGTANGTYTQNGGTGTFQGTGSGTSIPYTE